MTVTYVSPFCSAPCRDNKEWLAHLSVKHPGASVQTLYRFSVTRKIVHLGHV